MVVNDLNVLRAAGGPPEADPVLVIDPDAVLSSPVSSQLFEAIRRWCAQVAQLLGLVELIELALCDSPERARADLPRHLGVAVVEDIAGARAGKRPNHGCIVTDTVIRGNRAFSSSPPNKRMQQTAPISKGRSFQLWVWTFRLIPNIIAPRGW